MAVKFLAGFADVLYILHKIKKMFRKYKFSNIKFTLIMAKAYKY